MDTDGTGWGDNGSRIDVEQFDYESLDTLEDRIREGISKGENVTKLVRQLTEMEINEAVNEGIAAVVSYIADSVTPRLIADHIAWIAGMRARQGISLPAIAENYGVSKQAFCAAAIKTCKILKLKPGRAMRSELAKQVMHLRHYKRKRNERNTNTKRQA